MVTRADLDSEFITFARNDNPIVLSDNDYPDKLTNAGMFWTDAGDTNETDITDPAFPTIAAYTGGPHQGTAPIGATGATVYLNFEMSDASFDYIYIQPLVLGDTTNTVDVYVEIADSDDFATNNREIARWQGLSGVNPPRLIALRLLDASLTTSTAQRYSATDYMRICFERTAGGDWDNAAAIMPIIGDVRFGRRRQWHRKLLVPFDEEELGISTSDIVAKSRARTRYKFSDPYSDVSGTYPVGGKSNGLELDDLQVLRTMFRDSDYGADTVVYVEDPVTNPVRARCGYYESSELSAPLDGPFSRTAEFNLLESPPMYEYERAAGKFPNPVVVSNAPTASGGGAISGTIQTTGGWTTYAGALAAGECPLVFELVTGPGFGSTLAVAWDGTYSGNAPISPGSYPFTVRSIDVTGEEVIHTITLTVT